jgi:hypothetical protein
LTEEVSYTPGGATVTYVTETNSAGRSYTYTIIPPSAPSYVPTPSSYATKHGEVTYEYIPTSTGYETVEYNTVSTPSGFVTYVSVPTANGYSDYTESTSTSTTP